MIFLYVYKLISKPKFMEISIFSYQFCSFSLGGVAGPFWSSFVMSIFFLQLIALGRGQFALLERASFSVCLCWCEQLVDYSYLSVFGFSILLHWPMCLLLQQYNTVLITVSLWLTSKSGKNKPSYFSFSGLHWLFQVFCLTIQVLESF